MEHIILWLSFLDAAILLTSITLFAIRCLKEKLKWLKYGLFFTLFNFIQLIFLQFIFFNGVYLYIHPTTLISQFPLLGIIGVLALNLKTYFFIHFILAVVNPRLLHKTRPYLNSVFILFFLIQSTFYLIQTLKIISLHTIFWNLHIGIEIVLFVFQIIAIYGLIKWKQVKQKKLKKPVLLTCIIKLVFAPFFIFSHVYYVISDSFIFNYYFNILFLLVLFTLLSIQNIKHISDESRVLPTAIPSSFIKEYQLTKREKEIIEKLIQGLKPQYIAGSLFISIKTVNTHIHHIYQKCFINSRWELIHLLRSYNT